MSRRLTQRETASRRARRLELLRQAHASYREEKDKLVPLEKDLGDLGNHEEENNIDLPEEEDLEKMSDPPSTELPVFALAQS